MSKSATAFRHWLSRKRATPRNRCAVELMGVDLQGHRGVSDHFGVFPFNQPAVRPHCKVSGSPIRRQCDGQIEFFQHLPPLPRDEQVIAVGMMPPETRGGEFDQPLRIGVSTLIVAHPNFKLHPHLVGQHALRIERHRAVQMSQSLPGMTPRA